MKIRLVPLAMCALLLPACRSSGSGGGPPPPPPPPAPPVPTNVAAVQSAYGQFLLSWDASAAVEWFEVEARAGDAPFEPVADSSGVPVHSTARSMTIVADGVPELEALGFRVRSSLRGTTSAWSEIATARQGILPVADLSATAAIGPDGNPGPPVTVSWTSPSGVATELEASRATADMFGNLGPWQSLGGDAARERLLDAPSDGAAYRYRVRRGAMATWSAWAEARLVYPLLAPLDLRVEPVVDGEGVANAFRLTWTNRSTAAPAIAVVRATDSFPGTNWTANLAPGDTSYVDRFPAWPSYEYTLELSRPGYSWARTGTVAAPRFLIPGDPPVEAGSVELPCNKAVLRNGAGRWVCSSEDPPYFEVLHWVNADGVWRQQAFPGGSSYLLVAVDATGAPHGLRVPLDKAGARHGWDDGTAWHEEDVPVPFRDPGDPYAVQARAAGFGVTASGAPLVLIARGSQWVETYTVLGHDETGGWSERPVHIRPGFYFELQSFRVAPDGAAVVFGDLAIQGAPTLCAMARLGLQDSAAELEPIAGTDGVCFGGYMAVLLGAESGRVAIAYGLRRENLDVDWLYREYTAAGWSEPEHVVTQPLSRRVNPPGGILSHDGVRAALFLSWPVYRYADAQVYKAFARGRLGGWRELTFGPGFPDSSRLSGGGYLGDGRMWILGETGAPWQATSRYAVYEER